MKKILFIFVLFLSFCAKGQKIVDRANGASTVRDMRLMAGLNFYAPRFTDTTQANLGSNRGVDSSGALIYTYNTDSYWYRACFPVKHWVQVGSGSSGGTNIYNSDGTLTGDRVLSGSNTHVLTFDSLAGFGTFSYTDNINYTQIQQDPNEVSMINIHNSVDSHVAVDAGTVQIRAEDSVRISYPGVAPSTAVLGTNRIVLRSPTGGLLDYTGVIGALFGVGDTLFSANRYTNAANYTFKHKNGVDNFGGVDSCGARLSYAWSTNPLSASVWTSSGTAPTTSGSNTTINGTNTLTSLIHTGVENWRMTGTFITNVKSGSTQNISISLNSDTLSGITSRRFVFVMQLDSALIDYYNNDAGTIPNYSNKLTTAMAWSAADTFDFQIVYHRGVVTSYLKNRANGQKSVLNFTYTNTANVAQIKINTVGNFTYVGNFVYTIDEPFRPKFLLIDNSTGIGSGASSTYYRWWDNLFANYSDLHVMHSGAGERSAQGVLRIDEIVNAIQPQYIIYGYGVNDLAGGSIALFSQNTRRISDSANAHGIGLVFSSLVPQVATVQTYNDTITAIATAKGGRYVNITTTLQQGNGGGFNKNTIYQPTSDLVHLNDLGQTVQADLVAKKISDLLTCVPTLVDTKYPLFSGNYKFLAGFNDKNELVAIPDGLSNNYIQNLAPVVANVQQTAQTASMNISGDQLIGGNVYWIGNGNFSNPVLKLTASTGVITTAGGTLTVGQFNAGNFNVTSNSPAITGGTFQWSGNASNLIFTPYLLMVQSPDGQGTTVGVTVDNNGANNGSTYIMQRWRKNSVTKAWVDRDGGYHTDTISGYNYNVSSLYQAQSWTSKKYVDSLVALGAGGAPANTNLGAGYRLVVPASQGIKTIFNNASTGISWDSTTNANGITPTMDTLLLATRSWRQKGIDSVVTLISASAGITINTTSITSGTQYRVLFESSGNKVSELSGFTFDAVKRLYLPDAGSLRIGTTVGIYVPNQTSFPNVISVGDSLLNMSAGASLNAHFGMQAGKAITSGASNTFIGARSGQATNSASNSTFVGDAAGFSNTTGASNTYVGKSAGQGNSTSSNIVAIGMNAFIANTAAQGVAIGTTAGSANTSGPDNVLIGFQAGFQNVTGGGNTIVGTQSAVGVSSNSFSNNTYIGYKVALANTTGSGNIAIGDSAARTLTTALRSITIGTNLTENGNFSLNIGGAIFGTGMTATGTGTAGSIGIAVVSPTARLMLPAGTATANTAPLKFTSGTNLTSPEGGAVEYDGTDWYGTNGTATRGTFARTVTNVSNSGTATLAAGVSDYIFSGTIATWTLPALTGSTNVKFFLKNRGSGTLTINSNAGGNDIYTTLGVSTTTVAPGGSIILVSDGTFWNVE